MRNLNLLCLNCQKGYQPDILGFLPKILASNFYDFLLLQEADDNVRPVINSAAGYRLLKTINPGNNLHSHLGIVYRADCRLLDSDFLSFAHLEKKFAARGELGFLLGKFEYQGKQLAVGSIHLHPGFVPWIRRRELKMIKAKLLLDGFRGLPTVFGGDFNVGFPREGKRAAKFLAPEFQEATRELGPTLNSRYTEKSRDWTSRFGYSFAKFGIGIKIKTDRVFLDRQAAAEYQVAARVLPDRVSDHSPVEVILNSPP